jgi:RNA polymerase sigma-70 factor, ECF subfamily
MAPRIQAIDYEGLAETDLVALARGGDREAFRAIMTRCNQRLFRIARSVVRDHDEAEDVLQEAYTRAFSKLEQFRGDSSLFTWLTAITLNEARGRLRRRRTTVGMEQLEAAQQRGAEILMFPSMVQSSNPELEVAQSQIRVLLENAIDELPEPFRLVFIMREIEECSIEETATLLGLKPDTVKTRLFRARKHLRRLLDEKLSAAVTGVFPFLGSECARSTETVLRRLSPRFGWPQV